MTSTDRIEKTVLLRAPRARVWRALTDATEFSAWFRVDLKGAFEVGKTITGNHVHAGFEHVVMEATVVQMEAERLFSYRWHPYNVDAAVDYSSEPATLVEFRLEDVEGGTQLTVVESGFDSIPASRRDLAFRMNEKGWTGQLNNIRKHVAG